MISIDEALDLVIAALPSRRVERVFFQEALGCVLAEDLKATSNVPPFNRSAMDGYAVRAADLEHAPVMLELAGEIRAGGGNAPSIRRGQAVAIMTGAPVPEGADAVQIVEQSERSADGKTVNILKSVKPGENIAPLGCEAVAGETVLEAGRAVGPGEIAVMATFGYSEVNVWQKPRVALLATGDELVEVPATPRPDQIRNSNAYALAAQLRQLGLGFEYLGIARDDREELRRRMQEGLERDILILTGGVSMGEYDFVQNVFLDLGLDILFNRVAVKPGKPIVFARRGSKLVFGLPGNPVSTFMAFENFVRPALGRLLGLAHPELPRVRGELLQEMRQTPGRTSFMPAWVSWEETGCKIDPLPWKGSADLIGFAKSNATVIFPEDRSFMGRGESAEAMLLPDFITRLSGRCNR